MISQNLPRAIHRLLSNVRHRIRMYICAEALSLSLFWLGVCFWVGLFLDYVPVRFGADELSRTVRLCLLVVTAGGFLWILYRWLIRRLAARLADPGMALLVERRFPEFEDRLVTTVELSRQPPNGPLAAWMLARTTEETESRVGHVRVGRLFNYRPLYRRLAAALVAVASVVVFAAAARDAFAIWTARFYLLADQPWPRRAHIELVGFDGRTVKVAEGSDFTIRVRALSGRRGDGRMALAPETCTIYYQVADGQTGRAAMVKDGEPRGGYQHYFYRGQPFRGMFADVRFDVVGMDHRLRDYRIEVVKSPMVTDIQLDCQRPSYTGLGFKRQAYHAATQLPAGTRVQMEVRTSKPLRAAIIKQPESGDRRVLEFPSDRPPVRFFHKIDRLDQSLGLEILLTDVDGIDSPQPYRVILSVIEDQPPVVAAVLDGIGSAITADAALPAVGKIEDDYTVAAAWFQLQRDADQTVRRVPIPFKPNDQVDIEHALDLRDLRAADEAPLSLERGQKLVVRIQARDECDLGQGPHVGEGDQIELSIVEPDELLAMLEGRELALRRRFEQIVAETNDVRDLVLQTRAALPTGESPPRASPAPGVDSSLELLRVQRAASQSQKLQYETAGVAASFQGIRKELINNRVDSEERKERLEGQIINPLVQISTVLFPQFLETLRQLESPISRGGSYEELAERAVDQADELVMTMERVLARMLELETYNELLDLVRTILDEQEQIRQQTDQERKRQLEDLFE